ncbi:two-component system, chemotaxis family, response regulator CheB [Stigmatella aurantiaca]|uniref:Protein-glutamate methylesterase/protein-glutamine glutaminase n=1 Tax=Stigmatella aurantiaca TaxID=41 RepID=A0A1H8EPL1_STIAU|nr:MULTISPECIES: chemotaxis-specific protein-glutamate methyltransferase CheB [Stigmatella]SEN21423.1 two-component system, chemotaxis family, response regulator CheB [Stigmatella aurantiaca]
MTARAPIRVLVIDDSAHNRRTLTQLLGSARDVEVVGEAEHGEEGLRKVLELHPDVVTVDLEMPRLGGYTFLRLLRGTAPTPVIVISSYSHQTDVFKALELGAFDFIAKPQKATPEALESLRVELLEKVRASRLALSRGSRREALQRALGTHEQPPFVVAVAASTGGPPAVQRLLEALAVEPTPCVLVCQHMPAQFTRAFAERLDRIGPFNVTEACEGDRLLPGHVYIAPGGRHMVLEERSGRLELSVPQQVPGDRYAPSADRLFASIARHLGDKALVVVLTGMGSDGAEGAKQIHQAGGEVWAESEETAVVFGMPQEVIATGVVRRVLPLGKIGPALVVRARRRRSSQE